METVNQWESSPSVSASSPRAPRFGARGGTDRSQSRARESNMSELKIVQEIDGEYTGPRSVLFFGVRQPSYVPFDPNFEAALPRLLTRPDDVWIASYPKSGDVWDFLKLLDVSVGTYTWYAVNEKRKI